MKARVIQGFFVGGHMRPVVRQSAPTDSRLAGPPASAFVSRSGIAQAKSAPGASAFARRSPQPTQRFGGDGSFEIDPTQIELAHSGGRPLPDTLLAKMEAAFGANFSAVRVHVGPQASRIGAIAFTTGDDLYFAPGRFQPDSVQGQQLIGHELAHVVQQRQGRVPAYGPGVAVVQDRALEAEADRLGMRAAAHRLPLQAKMAQCGPIMHAPRIPGITPRGAIQRASSSPTFTVSGITFPTPSGFSFSTSSAEQAVTPMPRGTIPTLVGVPAKSGVQIGDIGSYAAIQYVEKVGDKLTGDHQPSGAAIKENIRLELHTALKRVLTRGMAKVAYQKAITLVMTDVWHKAASRTYGGRNSKSQIEKDAADMVTAAIKDWGPTVTGLSDEGFDSTEIQAIWQSFNEAREEFFKTGEPQFTAL